VLVVRVLLVLDVEEDRADGDDGVHAE
jgi:hypothetical protein